MKRLMALLLMLCIALTGMALAEDESGILRAERLR